MPFPVTRQPMQFPGVARYPIDAWEDAGNPMLTRSGWSKLCMRIAQRDMKHLQSIFEIAQKLEAEEERTPTLPPKQSEATSSHEQAGEEVNV